MFWHAKNGTVKLEHTEMNYVSFGTGKDVLILLPGISDGLVELKGKALALAFQYRHFSKHFTVYMFSRKNPMPSAYTIQEMASDQIKAMDILGIKKASILGVSQGGMIAQCLALDYPQYIEKLVLVVTAPCVNELIKNVIERWVKYAEHDQYEKLLKDALEQNYSEKYLRRVRKFYPFFSILKKPKTFERFLINAKAILRFDIKEKLNQIHCPTLIVAGQKDKVVGHRASLDMAREIPKSELYVYADLGHAAYEEAKDFQERVLNFLI